MIGSAPERSIAQRMDALEYANEIRSYRAELKRQMKARAVAPVEVLADPVGEVATMKVLDLLLATPRVGRVKASKVLLQHGISPSKTVGGLTERQRHELMAVCGRWSVRR